MESKLHDQILEGRLTKNQCASIEELEVVGEFQGILGSIQGEEARWIAFLDHPNAETVVPDPWLLNDPDMSPEINQVLKMIIVKILRPDRLIYATWTLIEMVLGERVANQS